VSCLIPDGSTFDLVLDLSDTVKFQFKIFNISRIAPEQARSSDTFPFEFIILSASPNKAA
jgi:hypothetical protein